MHDNVRQHTAAHSAETLGKLKFNLMAHPPYSSDLVPSVCHLIGSLKEASRGHQFNSDQEVKAVVHMWLVAQRKMFFS
jgi:histone-lysine N-methyltransferase SETMAR